MSLDFVLAVFVQQYNTLFVFNFPPPPLQRDEPSLRAPRAAAGGRPLRTAGIDSEGGRDPIQRALERGG